MVRRPMHRNILKAKGRGRGDGSGRGSWRASNSLQVEETLEVAAEDLGIQNHPPPNIENHNEQPQETVNTNDNVVEEQNESSDEGEEHIPREAHFINGRRVLKLVGDELLSSDCVARAIRGTFKARIDPLGSSWADVSFQTKELYFDEFKKVYHWEEGMEARVRKAWNKKAAKRYSDMLSKAKANNKKPPCVPQNIWEGWREAWKSEKVVRLAKRNRKNRKGRNGAGPSTHTGGSVSILEHSRRLELKWGRAPTLSEVYVHTHTKNRDGKTFVDAKAKAFNDRMVELRSEKQARSEEIDENQIYLEVAAAVGNRSDRIYGLGTLGIETCRNNKYGLTGYTSTVYTAKLENEVKDLKQVVGNVTQELRETKQQMEERMQQLVRDMISNMSQSSSSNDRSLPSQP